MLLLLLAASACRSQRPAPTVAFGRCDGRAYEIHIRGTPSACAVLGEGEFALNLAVQVQGTDLLIGAHNTTNGSKLSADGVVVESDKGNALLRLPVGAALAGLRVAQGLGGEPVDFGKTFTLSLPGRSDVVVKVPPIAIGPAIVDAFGEVAKGPVKLGNEGPAPAAHSVLFAERAFASPLIGPAKTVGEIDWVAVKTTKGQHEIGTCEYDVLVSKPGSTRAGGRFSAKKLGLEESVTIYERRTAKVVDRRDFRATEGACPRSLGSAAREVRIGVDLEQVRAWLSERVAK